MAESMAENKSFIPALLAGGAAGIAVDFVLYPLDTIKTRLQSEQGLWKSGGLHGLYRGLTSVAVGSAPSAAMFFMTYEMSKNTLTPHVPQQFQPFVHMFAAGFGETAACIVRVPCEVCKQRAQASKSSPLTFFTKALQTEGISGLYRGYLSTVLREIPFAFLQFPMWEFLKSSWSKKQGHTVEPWQSSLCGAIAGAFAASSTTPLDVAKTRIMLAEANSPFAVNGILYTLKAVQKESGFRGLFSGLVPRVCWISLGGAIFLGAYDKVLDILSNYRTEFR